MADMLEYYQQISELKKAVRERELHRLELEKQSLLNAQKRERRHEDFKDKIREIQRELNQRETEASKNFQTLIARVDSIRKEHQLLAAHTEQLRQRKLQYETSLKSANPLLHSAVHKDSSGIFDTSGEALWKDSYQVTSTPASKSQPLWATPPSHPQQLIQTLPPQPHVSPIASYSTAPTSHGITQPMENYMTRRDINGTPQQQPSSNVHMTTLISSSNSQNQDPISQGGMISHIQSNADNIRNNYSQPSHIYPSTSPMQSLSTKISLQEQTPNNGLTSQIHNNFATTSSAYSQPSNVGYKNLVDIYKTEGAYQNQTDILPPTRGNIDHSRSSNLDAGRPTSSNPVNLQGITSPSAAETNYLHHLQGALQQTSQATHQLQPQSTLQPQPQLIPQTHISSTLLTQQPSTFLPQQPSTLLTQQPSTLLTQQPSTFLPQQPSTLLTQQPSTLLTQQPSTFLPQQPSTLLTQQPSTLLTQQPSTHLTQQPSTLQPQPPSFPPQLQSALSTEQPLAIHPQPQSNFYSQPQSIPQTQPPATLQPQSPSFPSELQSSQSSAIQPQPQSNLCPQPQAVLQPQKYAETNPLQINEYLTPVHNNPLVTSTNSVPTCTPDKTLSMNGGAEKGLGIMSHHLRDLPYDSITHESLQPSSLNTTLHPELGMQGNNNTCPTTSGIYIPKSNLYINGDLPEKDTDGQQALSLKDDRVTTNKFPSNSSEQEVAKNFAMLKIDDKPSKMFSQREYDERAHNDNEPKIYSNSDMPLLKPDIPLASEYSLRESEQNRKTPSPEKSTLENSTLANRKAYPIEADHDTKEPSILTNRGNSVDVKQNSDSKPHQSLMTDDRNTPPELNTSETVNDNATNNSLKDNGVTSLTHPKQEIAQKILKSPDSLSSSSKEMTSPLQAGSPTRPTSVLSSKIPTQRAEDSKTDFFDQNINVTDTAAYKSLVSGGRKSSVGMESESDEAEGQLSALIAKPQTTKPRPSFKPFASSIPSLRPAPADTDTDSVDSVEAAIQAAMKNKDQAAASELPSQVQQPQSPLNEEVKSGQSTEQKGGVKPGTDRVLGSNKPKAAVPINLDSDAESYEVSAGADASDEDDFDFYDKF